MGTKLKRYSRTPGVKAAVYSLIVLMVVGFTAQFVMIAIGDKNGDFELECLFTQWYENSGSVYDDLYAFNREIAGYDRAVNRQDISYARIKSDGSMISNIQGGTLESGMYAMFNDSGDLIWISNPPYEEQVSYVELMAGNPDAAAFISLSDGFLKARQDDWLEQNRAFLPYIILGIAQIVIFIALFVCASFMAGRKAEDDELHPSVIDKAYTDVLIAVLAFFMICWCMVGIQVIDTTLAYGTSFDLSNLSTTQILLLMLLGLASLVTAAVGLIIYLSCIRKIKAGTFLKSTLIYTVAYKLIWKCLKTGVLFFLSYIDGRRYARYPFAKMMFYKQLGYAVMQSGLLLLCILFSAGQIWGGVVLFLLTSVALTLVYVRSNNTVYSDMTGLCDQIREVNAGDLLYLPPMSTSSPLYESRKLLAKIGNGMQNSVDKAVKSERMKIDLVTNVSHDLKTPLTSIISYVDLLAKEEGLSPEARDYVNILAKKSDRLKQIVSDLFDLAKTTSGDAKMNMEKLDLKKLVEQTLADMEDMIEASERVMRINLPQEAVMVCADGKKLYRVMQNVLDNSLKYSMEKSRIFIDLKADEKRAVLTVKNTAGYEMEFTSEEVMERFNRGDKTRSTEGSGLGICIAESFTKASGGDFSVAVDGDLFKVTVGFDMV